MIPLYHDFTDETVLVFGGGSVGARKARRFADEARVIVVSPTFAPSLTDHRTRRIELVRAVPAVTDVSDWIDRASPALVVAATDDAAVNAAVAETAGRAGALVNRTDASGGRRLGSVVVPGTVEDDPVSVAVSSGGTSPALTKVLRERIEAEIDGAGAMAELSGSLREELKSRAVEPTRRREAIRAVVRSDRVWKGLQEGRSKGRQEAEKVIEEVLRG